MLVCELISLEVHSVKIKLHGTKILDKMYSASEMCTMYKFRRGNCVTDCLTFLFLFSRNSKRQTPGIDEDVSLRYNQQKVCKSTKLWFDPWISTRLRTLFLRSFFWLDANTSAGTCEILQDGSLEEWQGTVSQSQQYLH